MAVGWRRQKPLSPCPVSRRHLPATCSLGTFKATAVGGGERVEEMHPHSNRENAVSGSLGPHLDFVRRSLMRKVAQGAHEWRDGLGGYMPWQLQNRGTLDLNAHPDS